MEVEGCRNNYEKFNMEYLKYREWLKSPKITKTT